MFEITYRNRNLSLMLEYSNDFRRSVDLGRHVYHTPILIYILLLYSCRDYMSCVHEKKNSKCVKIKKKRSLPWMTFFEMDLRFQGFSRET